MAVVHDLLWPRDCQLTGHGVLDHDPIPDAAVRDNHDRRVQVAPQRGYGIRHVRSLLRFHCNLIAPPEANHQVLFHHGHLLTRHSHNNSLTGAAS